jgi:hypothetical protein
MRYLVSEILEQLTELKVEADRVALLKKYSDNVLLKEVLKLNFDPEVKFDLPAGEPPYKVNPQPAGLVDSNLYAEGRRMYLLIKGHPRRPAGVKRQQIEGIFIQMLEGIHKGEAELLIALKDKALAKKYKGLTEKTVRAAFPDILPENKAVAPKEAT